MRSFPTYASIYKQVKCNRYIQSSFHYGINRQPAVIGSEMTQVNLQ